MSAIKVTKAKPEDIGRLEEIREKAWLTTYPNKMYGITREDLEPMFVPDQAKEEKKRKFLENIPDTALYLVAKIDSKAVGFCYSVKDGENEIKSLYVDPDFQGRGAGKELMKKTLEWFSEGKIVLWVASYNRRAIGFYKKFGFCETGETQSLTLSIGKKIPITKMERAK